MDLSNSALRKWVEVKLRISLFSGFVEKKKIGESGAYNGEFDRWRKSPISDMSDIGDFIRWSRWPRSALIEIAALGTPSDFPSRVCRRL